LGIFNFKQKEADVPPKQLSGMEPKTTVDGKLECLVCHLKFGSRNEYDDHWLSCHGDDEISLASGSMGSMQSSGQQQCEKALSS
jgi:hypothetical protein